MRTAHFRPVLSNIRERTATASERNILEVRIPISPYQIAYNFLATCRSLDLDGEAVDMVQDLFERFVLDRLGNIYGDCNQRLEEAGFGLAVSDDELASSA